VVDERVGRQLHLLVPLEVRQTGQRAAADRPRQLAARLADRRIAQQLGDPLAILRLVQPLERAA
jgi:hypothetical protein